MSDEINAQFGFERVFGKTNGNADADTKITEFGISFNSDGTTTFYAELEKSSASQKEYLEKIQEKKAAEKKEIKKKEQSKQIEVFPPRRLTSRLLRLRSTSPLMRSRLSSLLSTSSTR